MCFLMLLPASILTRQMPACCHLVTRSTKSLSEEQRESGGYYQLQIGCRGGDLFLTWAFHTQK